MKRNLVAILSICFLFLCSSFVQADLEFLSSTLKSGDYMDVYVNETNNLAYFVNGRGVEIYSLENPNLPTFVGEIDTPGFAGGVFVKGDYVYVADYWNGLAIINAANPENPELLAHALTLGAAEDVVVSEGPPGELYAYVADGDWGLAIINVTNPEAPGEPGYVETYGGYALGVFVDDRDYAYVANGWMDNEPAGLTIVNIAVPEEPGDSIFVETEGSAEDVFVSGNYAYVADGDKGLALIDVTNPEDPGEPEYIIIGGDALGVFIDGNYAYVANSMLGLAIVDLNTKEVIRVPTADGPAEDVFVSENYAYVANSWAGIAIVDLSVPQTVEVIDTPGYALGVYVDENYAHVAHYDNHLAIADVGDPTNPIPLEMPPDLTTGLAEGVFVNRSMTTDKNYAYVADHGSGLAIIDVEDPANPVNVWQYLIPDAYSFGVFVSGNYAYVAYGGAESGDGGLAIIDVTNPEAPGDMEIVPIPGAAGSVFVSEGPESKWYAYVAYGWRSDMIDGWIDSDLGGLIIVDVTDPTNPEILSDFPLSGYAYGVSVSEDYAYVANTDGLAVIDVSDPEFPGYVTLVDIGPAFDVYVIETYAYVANYDKGLAVVDISDPTDPRVKDTFNTSGWAYRVFVESTSPENAIVYVADQYSLTIIAWPICVPPLGDVSGNCIISAYDAAMILQYVAGINPLDDDPNQKDRADVTGNGTISGLDAAWVLQYTVGLRDLPTAPVLNPDDEQKLLASAISDLERVPLSQEQRMVLEQLKHLSQSFPARTALLQNYPNPFNPETWIPYQLEKDSNVTIRIMDIQGRLVRQLNLGSNHAGAYVSRERAAYWDGRNTFGEKVSSGIYFYTLQVENSKQAISTGLNEAGKFTATRKMVIMK